MTTPNMSPIYTLTPNVGGIGNAVVTAANTAFDGTGTVTTIFTAGAAGSFVQRIRCLPSGGASNNNVASVARFFLNNGSTQGTATNNIFIGEVTLPATTGSATAALATVEFPINFYIQNGYKINVVLGTAVATGYWFSCVGGDF